LLLNFLKLAFALEPHLLALDEPFLLFGSLLLAGIVQRARIGMGNESGCEEKAEGKKEEGKRAAHGGLSSGLAGIWN